MSDGLRPLLDELGPGAQVFVQGGVGEPQGLIDALRADPDRAAGVEFTVCMIPGINSFDYAGLHPAARLNVFMPSKALSASFSAGRARSRPLSYAGAAASLAQTAFDLVIAQAAPPTSGGRCAFGISGDFPPLVWERARRRALILNPAAPAPRRSESVDLASADVVVEDDSAFLSTPEPRVSETLGLIAERVAEIVPNGAAIQTGVGAAPGAVLAALRGHRRLVIRSGLIIDAYRRLAEAGALDPDGAHVAGVAYGAPDFYAALAAIDIAAFASVRRTHAADGLVGVPRFTAINSALEVDLFGQANVEWLNGEAISGVGGAPDFARAALASEGGQFILALPSRAGGRARIVPRLSSPTVSLSRSETDVVVTEYGVARLRALDEAQRAAALIALAHPDDRDGLGRAYSGLRG